MTFTFEGAPSGTRVNVGTYSAAGMYFGPIGPGNLLLNGGGIAGYPDDGTGYLEVPDGNISFNFSPNEIPFTLISLDAPRFANFAPPTLEVVGYKAQIMGPITTVTNFFTVTSANFQTFYPDSSFQDVFQVSVLNARWSLDNLVIGVPEPTSTAFLAFATGTAFCWHILRRNR
jgi:hypothetical protein